MGRTQNMRAYDDYNDYNFFLFPTMAYKENNVSCINMFI